MMGNDGIGRFAGVFAFVLLMLASASWADIAFSSSSVSPSTLRPGVSGTASFVVTNTGTATISGLAFDASGYGFILPQAHIIIGDIGASGSTQVTIPFIIKSDVPAGVYTLQASTILSSGSGTSSGITSRTFTIPVTVSNPATFEVSSTADKAQVSPGGSVRLHLKITNKGGAAGNVRISANSTNFVIKDASQVAVGSIPAEGVVETDIEFTASSTLSGGTYSIPVKITYEDSLGSTNADGANLGPVLVVKISTDFGLMASTSKDLYPGDKFDLYLDVQNNGVESAYAAVIAIAGDSKSGQYFVALDSAEGGLGNFGPGEAMRQVFHMGVNGNAPPGYYALNATITFVNAQGEATKVSKLFGLEVLGRYDVSVVAEPSPKPVTAGRVYSLSVQVSNTGTGDLKAVSTELIPSNDVDVIGMRYGFIGELKESDYSSTQYDVYVKPGLAPGRYAIEVNVTFFDTYNREHTVKKLAYVDVVSADIAALATGGSTGPSTIAQLAGLAVLAVVLWYANRKGWLDGVKSALHVAKKK
ncbi:MAG: hypothetical protein Q7T16_00775 [Candidatus Burarchaeum sp.]|nr:hypothetical protein [Candidatus Burarchaeum sp.]MDO8339170.1 hypothetical protein [Candidatus Burarchaeum sp.]